MRRTRSRGLPLLTKELVELSAKPRTYLVRVIYATVLLLVCCGILFSAIPGAIPVTGSPGTNYLGLGWPVVIWLGYLQRTGLHLVLPVLACGVFTIEKERNTLGLLFLTQLQPWTIVWEKFLSRLLLAFSFLIISAPLLSFAYSLGGVTLDDLASHFYVLLITSVKIVSVCLLCSAYFRTTTGALLASYVMIYAVGIGTYFVSFFLFNALWAPPRVVFANFPIYIFFIDRPPLGFVGRPMGPGGFAGSYFLRSLVTSIPTLLVSGACVAYARQYLVSRAFAPPSRYLKVIFDCLDGFFTQANNNSWTQGIVLTRSEHREPTDAPIAWRETSTRSVGRLRYLVRLLFAIELPVLMLMVLAEISGDYRQRQAISSSTLIVLWAILALGTSVFAAGLMTGERRQQTLDVLLATPMAGRDIVLQKMAGLRRLIWLAQVPMWTCLGFYLSTPGFLRPQDMIYAINQLLMLLIYPWLIAWIAMRYGMSSKTTIAALLKTIVSIIGRCVIPYVVAWQMLVLGRALGVYQDWDVQIMFVTFLSPATFFFLIDHPNQSWVASDFPLTLPIAWLANGVIQGLMLYFLRRRCLNRADVLLGRIPPSRD